nr:unnamed protein product [Ipomoea trifida]
MISKVVAWIGNRYSIPLTFKASRRGSEIRKLEMELGFSSVSTPLSTTSKSESRNVSRISDVPFEHFVPPQSTARHAPESLHWVRRRTRKSFLINRRGAPAKQNKARDVAHSGLEYATGAPIHTVLPAEIPCDAPHRDEMIPAVRSVPVRLILDPVKHHLAIPITVFVSVIDFDRPQVLTHRESSVERYVERRSRFRLRGPALVISHAVVEDKLQCKLVRPKPRPREILRENLRNSGGWEPKSVVRQHLAARVPRVQFPAIFH